MLHHVIWQQFTDFSEVLTASIIRVRITLMMQTVSTSEMPVNVPSTWCNIPEHNHLQVETWPHPFPTTQMLTTTTNLISSTEKLLDISCDQFTFLPPLKVL
jgi:hypothetical protein